MDTLNKVVVCLLTKGYKQDVLAKVAGVSQMSISRWSKQNPRGGNEKAYKRLTKLLEMTRG